MIMKKYVLIIATLLLIALNSNAQYSLMSKGERCPFDTAVAIHIDTYRLESRKMKLADTMIVNLSDQVASLEGITGNLHLQLSFAADKIQLKEKEIRVKQETIDALLRQMEYQPQPSWWERNHKPVLFIGGVGVGIGGSILLINLLK